MRVDGKTELIDGRIVTFLASGHRPSLVAGRIFRRLADFADAISRGVAHADGVGYTVPELSTGRESFSPDASYDTGPLPANEMRFIPGPPDFAVEVRGENDYGPTAEEEEGRS